MVESCHYNVTRPRIKRNQTISVGQSERLIDDPLPVQVNSEKDRNRGSTTSLEEAADEDIIVEEIGVPESTSSSVLGSIL